MIKRFILKLIIYFVMFGLPLALVSFLVMGVVWMARDLFS